MSSWLRWSISVTGSVAGTSRRPEVAGGPRRRAARPREPPGRRRCSVGGSAAQGRRVPSPSVAAAQRRPAVRRLGQQPGAHRGPHVTGSHCGDDPLAAGLGRALEEEVDQASTNSSSMPGVRPAGTGTPTARPSGGFGVEVVDDLHVVGDEPDRAPDDVDHPPRPGPRCVVDVGLEPGLRRWARARAEHELTPERRPSSAFASSVRRPSQRGAGRRRLPSPSPGPEVSSIASGIECVT